MIPTVHKCPFCPQEFSRKYNKEVHIKRRHNGTRLLLNGASNAMSFRYPSYNPNQNQNQNQNPNYNPSNVLDNGEGIWGQTSGGNRQGNFMDSMIGFLRKQVEVLRYQVEIKELNNRFMLSPYYPPVYSQQFYYPRTLGRFVQKSPNFSDLPFHQSSSTSSNKFKSFQLISLKGLICDKCLTVDTIPCYQYEDGTLKEIHSHSCSEERVLNLERRDKHDIHRFFVLLCRMLPKILAAKVLMYNKSEPKIYLWSMKFNDLASSLSTDVYKIGSWECPIRFLDAFPSENRWLDQIRNSRKQENIIELESKEELLSFLEISVDSTMVILKVKRDSSLSSSESWDSYLIGVYLPEHNLEKINKPFIPQSFLN